jgi:kynureninase
VLASDESQADAARCLLSALYAVTSIGEHLNPMAISTGRFSGSQRAAFDVPGDIAYFNTANLAPQLHCVRQAGNAALRARARPWDISPEDWFTDADRLLAGFGRIIGSNPDGVALVPATSYGFATAIPIGRLHVAGRRSRVER